MSYYVARRVALPFDLAVESMGDPILLGERHPAADAPEESPSRE